MTVEARLSIEMYVECPYCYHDFDLLDTGLGLNDEGQMIRQACPESDWYESHKQFNESIECPECKKNIQVKSIAW